VDAFAAAVRAGADADGNVSVEVLEAALARHRAAGWGSPAHPRRTRALGVWFLGFWL